jgi:uncharacterized lipoprotein YddW (UPF0748 family)
MLPRWLSLIVLFCGVTAASGQTAFRGFWADAFHPGYKSTSEINTMIARAQAGNFNALIVEVLAYHDDRGTGHGAYWDSDLVPPATDKSLSDPLEYLITQAHANNLEVHAWIVPYRVSSTWPPRNNTILSAHPEWLMVPRDQQGGGPATVSNVYVLDPGSPDVQQYLMDVVAEIVTHYDVDGLNLDYIRYTDTDAGYPADESYANSSLARFQRLTGFEGTPSVGNDSWENFRRQTISEFVRRLHAELPALVGPERWPDFRFTADLIAFGNAPSSFTSSSAYNLFQNWEDWMFRGWLDAGIPMNYKREFDAAQAAWYRNWIDAALDWRYDRHLFAGQGNYLNSFADSVTQLDFALAAGCDGIATFSYWTTSASGADPNFYNYVAANLFTTPAALPAMPWKNPLLATEGTLWGQITDAATGAPVDGAVVTVAGQPTLTDGNGYYVISRLPTGDGQLYTAAIQADGCDDKTLTSITLTPGTSTRRDATVCDLALGPGDFDEDGDIDADDLVRFLFCMGGPDQQYPAGHLCTGGDFDSDRDSDLRDLAGVQQTYQP